MNRRNHNFSTVILAITVFSSLAFSISLWLLYQTAHDQQLRDAARSAETLANFIEAVARFDKEHSANDDPNGSLGATMRQIQHGIASNTISSGDMELTIGQRVGSNIRFLHKANRGSGVITEIPDDGKLATPLHLALQGQKGSGEYRDYRGVLVLAGYAPVPSLGVGVVYKADVDELRGPYYSAAAWACGILILMVTVFSVGFRFFNRRLAIQLDDSERRFASVISVAPVGVFETDSIGNAIFINEYWCSLAGLTIKESLGQGWIKALHPDDKDRVYRAWQDFVAGIKPFSMEYRFMKPDGTDVWVLGQAVALKDEQNQVAGYMGTVTDITHIYHVEQQLLLKDAAIEHALIGISISDLEGKLTYANPAFLKMWDYARQEDVIGRSTSEFWSDIQHASEIFNSLKQHGRWAGARSAQRVNGQKFIADMMAVVIYADNGEPQHILASFLDITERQRAEEALRDSEARYRSIIATMSEGVVVQQADGTIASCNAAAEDILGLSIDQMQGRTAMDPRWKSVREDNSPFPGDQHPGTVALNTGQSFKDTIMGIDHPTKGRRWISINAHPLLSADSITPYGSVASFTDITEHRQHEAQINASNQILNAVLDATPVLIAYLDRDMNFIRVNKAYANLDEKTPDYFPGKNHFELFPNAENEIIFNRVLTTGIPHVAEAKPFEYEHNPERGVTHWDWILTPIKDVSGEVSGLVLSLMDVTERVETLEALQSSQQSLKELNESLEEQVIERTQAYNESNQMLRLVLDATPLRIFWKDAKLNFLGCNLVFAQDAGKNDPAELIGKSDYDMAWKASADLYREDDAHVMASGQPKLAFEESMDLPDGKRIWLSTNKVPLRNGNNDIIGVLGTYENITVRKQIQQDLESAKNEAERANNAKSAFLSRMSHELRTPMNAILGFSQILEMEPLGEEAHSFVNEIHQAGDHLLELINDLLDLSRIEAGKMAAILETVDVVRVINDAVPLVQTSLALKHITLNIQCDSGTFVLADFTRLRQVFINLLSNAIKYNREGGRIDISCSVADNNRMRLSVTDTGSGITPENIKALFIPFERLGEEFGNIEGTGIGLVLSKELVELMGGNIGVTSQPGQGSTFWIELALAPPVEQKIPSSSSDVISGPEYKLLYVEDNAANLHLVEAIFRHRSHVKLLSATTGDYGLELAKHYLPDVILLDIHLPNMDGYQVLEALRQDESTRSIPVVALSADAMPIDIEKGLKAGFDYYLTKPVDVSQLLETLDRVKNTKT